MMNRHSIRWKLTRSFCVLILCALLVTNTITGVFLYGIYSKELFSNYRSIGNTVASQMENSLATVENFAHLICFDANLQTLMRTHLQEKGYPFYRETREITTALSQYVSLRDDLIDDIYVVDKENNIISRSGYYLDTLISGWYQDFLSRKTNLYFSMAHESARRDTNLSTNRKNVISCIVNMFDLKNPTSPSGFMGHVIINVKYDALVSVISGFKDMQYLIVASDGTVVGKSEASIDPEKAMALPQGEEYTRVGRYYCFQHALSFGGWRLVTSVEVSKINEQLLILVLFLIGITLLFMVLFGRIVVNVAQSITKPLKTLTEGILRFSVNDFENHMDIRSGDEVEEIAVVFNNMVDKIREQMEEILRKEDEKRKSEMRFLIAQIKPHFIYNSLDCIIYLARNHQDEDIILFTRDFISLLQTAIRMQPQQEVPLFAEIQYLRSYVTLIRYRYENAPEFSWHVDEGCSDLHLLGLILLPLLENSIFHGLLAEKKAGRVRLYVTRKQEDVEVRLSDDGSGIPPEQLEAIRGLLSGEQAPSDERKHIGLLNVSERLKLWKKTRSPLHVDSEEGVGTEVWWLMRP